MMEQSITIDQSRSDDEIVRAVAESFAITPGDVLVVADLQDVPQRLGRRATVICERRPVSGDFAMQIMLYLQDDTLQDQNEPRASGNVTATICSKLGVNCLLEGTGPNPYEAIYLPLRGAPRAVLLNAAALDNDDALVMARQPAATP